MSLEIISGVSASGCDFVAPSVSLTIQTSPRRELELGLCWEPASGPTRIGFRIFVRDMHDRMIHPKMNIG